MGFFGRKKGDAPANPEMVELGREYAIAKRHGDRRAVNRINRQIGTADMSDNDRASFEQGRQSYDAIPPVNPKRRTRRR
ncbi:hypothetical protein AB0A91_16580 [Streptomyces sp. NPDC042207]|uniref:hypothetical protein n=1 Tax=Streptomyces sp. NPDC042207 TaxID=3154331 RepID=UPI0033DA9C9A